MSLQSIGTFVTYFNDNFQHHFSDNKLTQVIFQYFSILQDISIYRIKTKMAPLIIIACNPINCKHETHYYHYDGTLTNIHPAHAQIFSTDAK